jgi:hypothetical protein
MAMTKAIIETKWMRRMGAFPAAPRGKSGASMTRLGWLGYRFVNDARGSCN